MNSTNFLIATIDKNFNMYKVKEGKISFIEHIAEHIKRLEEISENHHFFIDEFAFEALGRKNFPLRFTRVFAKDPELVASSKSYRVHDINELKNIVMSKDKYSPDTQIFFIGGDEFLLAASSFSKKLLLTVVDKNYDDNVTNIASKLPLNEFKEIFSKRRDIHPEMLEQIKAYKQIVAKKKQVQKVTIADNGMKIISTQTVEEFDPNDDILNTPDYMFYEYSR